MRPTFRKLEVKDIGNLERLVVENADGVEPGLMIVDSRLILGQAAIDLVGLDGAGSLVLIALSFSADDGLLLRAMDAYSWCLEYPDTLRRLYPMAKASSRPPRILFIVEKTTDVFLRRIKQLSVLEIDCFAFRHLEVNGAPVVYFDLVERLRKSIVESKVDGPTPAPAPPAKTAEARVKPRSGGPRVEPVRPPAEWSTLVESRAPVREPKRVDPPRTGAVEPVRVEPAAVVAAALQPATPIVAPTTGATIAPKSVRETTSRTRSSDRSKPRTRLSSVAATTASSGLPTAVNTATAIGASVVAFARNAPTATPGQTRRPRSSIAATATPDGGQTSVAVTPTVASVSPSLAARKYATATPPAHATSPRRSAIGRLTCSAGWLGRIGHQRSPRFMASTA